VDHKSLVGMKDQRLRILAPDATHQHFKGGLYRYLGLVKDADTGESIIGKDGQPRVAYMHCYPYDREIWIRDYTEWMGYKDDQPRFRKIEGTI
jgi:hypothetical protein